MAKPNSTSALRLRLAALSIELDELQRGAAALAGTANGPYAEGLSRAVREMRKTLDRVNEQGYVSKL